MTEERAQSPFMLADLIQAEPYTLFQHQALSAVKLLPSQKSGADMAGEAGLQPFVSPPHLCDRTAWLALH
jgi:hypothetical protein